MKSNESTGGWPSKHFERSEFACPCCGRVGKWPERIAKVLGKLDRLRDACGSIVITSGYRCQKHNRAVGGVPNSRHVRAEAVDCFCPTLPLWSFAKRAEQVGFGGIGYYPDSGFVHLDIGPWGRWKG